MRSPLSNRLVHRRAVLGMGIEDIGKLQNYVWIYIHSLNAELFSDVEAMLLITMLLQVSSPVPIVAACSRNDRLPSFCTLKPT